MIQPKPDPKTGVYKVRKVIPVELRPFLDGKSELKRSLNTKDANEAKYRAPAVVAEFQALVAGARLRLDNQQQERQINTAELDAIVSRWVTHERSRLDVPEIMSRYVSETDEGLESNCEWFSDPLEELHRRQSTERQVVVEERFVRYMQAFVDEALELSLCNLVTHKPRLYIAQQIAKWAIKLCNSAIDIEGMQRRELARGYQRSSLDALYGGQQPSRVTQQVIEVELASMGLTVHTDTRQMTPDMHDGNITANSTIRQLFEWRNAQEQLIKSGTELNRWLLDRQRPCMRAMEFFAEKPIGRIGKLELREFFIFITNCPVKPKQAVNELSFRKQIKVAKEQGLTTVSANTAKKELNLISGYFEEAVRFDILTTNPCHGVTPEIPHRAPLRDPGYSNAEIARIFALPMFKNINADASARFGQAPYWLPVLLALTGARAEEIAQLYVKDIEMDEGGSPNQWFIHIRAARENQSVKNGQARRVPVCNALLELGLLEYVRSLPQDGRLFPLLDANAKGKFHTQVSRFIGRQFRDANIELAGELKHLHAFRHRFITEARRVMREDRQNAITGHANTGNVGRRYGTYADLHEAINKMPHIPIPKWQKS